MGAHRASYLMFKGKIPPGKIIMHRCDNRRCVNPDHLVVGTYLENTKDMMKKNRHRFLRLKSAVEDMISLLSQTSTLIQQRVIEDAWLALN